jgi:hypothetical protein
MRKLADFLSAEMLATSSLINYRRHLPVQLPGDDSALDVPDGW